MPVPALAWRLIAPPMSNGGLLGRGASPRSRQCAAPHLSLAISPPISGPAHPRNRRRQVAGRRGRARHSRRPIPRIDQGGGKRRAGIAQRCDLSHRANRLYVWIIERVLPFQVTESDVSFEPQSLLSWIRSASAKKPPSVCELQGGYRGIIPVGYS